jgi:hypothetical protein
MIGIRVKGINRKGTRFYDDNSYCRRCEKVYPKALRCPLGHRMRNKPKLSSLKRKYLNSPMIIGG